MDVRSRGRSVHDDTDHNAALVQQFLNIALAQREPVVEPKGVLNDAQWKTVAVGRAVSHRGFSLLRLSCQNPFGEDQG